MTDKERLESLKRNREWTEATGGKFYTVDSDDYKWLIKQAERAERYEQSLEHMKREILKATYEQVKRYKRALEHIQKEIHKAIYTPKKQKWNSDFEREFEKGKTRGLIRASDIVKEAIEVLEGEK